MRQGILISIILLSSVLAILQPVLAEPTTWMEPGHPTDKDTIRIYCRAPAAYDVSFNVCADNGTVCYFQSAHGKTDSETWWVEVGPLPAGTRAHYEVTVIYQNETTGNESTVEHGPVHFEVSKSLEVKEDDSTPFPGIIFVAATIMVSAYVWGKFRRD